MCPQLPSYHISTYVASTVNCTTPIDWEKMIKINLKWVSLHSISIIFFFWEVHNFILLFVTCGQNKNFKRRCFLIFFNSIIIIYMIIYIFCLKQVQSPCLFNLVMLSHPIKLQINFIQLGIEFFFWPLASVVRGQPAQLSIS